MMTGGNGMGNHLLDTARRVLETESRAIAELGKRLDGSFERAVELLANCAGRVVVTGMGKSGLIGQKIAATFNSTGMPAYFMHPAEAVHGDLGMIVEGDLILALSNSGETEELVRLLELIRRLGASIVAVSGAPESTLARHADVHLDASVSREACSLDLVPTASTTACLALGDALAIACYERRGFSAGDFARFHPGGRLGRKLLQVHQLMRKAERLAAVPESASMADSVREISTKDLGMTCVIDSGNRLVGVLTDGDLRRWMLQSATPLDGGVEQAMTRNPITIEAEALATEALRVMEERKITCLPVVGADDELLGVIQIHDLWRTELF
jgi:arabinose-5-phosphate isomerase